MEFMGLFGCWFKSKTVRGIKFFRSGIHSARQETSKYEVQVLGDHAAGLMAQEATLVPTYSMFKKCMQGMHFLNVRICEFVIEHSLWLLISYFRH